MSYKVNVVIEKDDNGYYAYSPELEGCQSQGYSYEEALSNIREAVDSGEHLTFPIIKYILN